MNTKDGYTGSCKPCRKLQQQIYRKTEKGKAKDKRYNDSSKRYACLYRYWEKNPIKKYCQTKLSNALRSGRLTNPHICSNCGDTDSVEGHHWNYSEEYSLDIIWVCKYCHEREHERIKVLGYPCEKKLWIKTE
tara:strand:- start:18923 stop:19321 length:399 start_codon:yes stop_codon:yes gene_type:complete